MQRFWYICLEYKLATDHKTAFSNPQHDKLNGETTETWVLDVSCVYN